MADNFKKVVNLQTKQNDQNERPSFGRNNSYNPTIKRAKSRAEEIDKVYGEENNTGADKKDMGKIDRPLVGGHYSNFYKLLSLVLLLAMVMLVFFYFVNKRSKETAEKNNTENHEVASGSWYSLQLTSGEVFYGFIKDTKADPIVLENVFYNYDQINKTDVNQNTETENKSIRLVKRGKESHGPNGTMDVVRSQALYMEPLSDDSKILKAILEYEKQ